MIRIRVGLFLGFAMMLSCLTSSKALAASPESVPETAQLATIRSVADGDTLRVTLDSGEKTTVRLIGADAPPTKGDTAATCFAEEATAQLSKSLKVGRQIWLEKDIREEDHDGRLLRYVWVEKKSGGVYLLNETLLRDGYAVYPADETNLAYKDRLLKAELTGRAAGRGLWFACQQYLRTSTDVVAATSIPTAIPESPSGLSESEASYAYETGGIATYVGDCLVDLGEQATQYNPFSDEWVLNVAGDLACIRIAYAELQAIGPPPAFELMHSYLLQALSSFDSATYDFAYGVDNFDAASIELATSKFQDGTYYLDLANEELERIREERGL